MSAATRDELRQSYVEAWHKHKSGAMLTPLQAMQSDVIGLHPEYHPLLGDPQAALGFDTAAGGGENPFLHMGVHMAVREQLSVDRPPGVRALHDRLVAHCGAHAAEHVMMDALAQILWDAQSSGQAPDEQRYLWRAHRRLDSLAKS